MPQWWPKSRRARGRNTPAGPSQTSTRSPPHGPLRDRDLPRLRLLALVQRDGEDAVLEPRLDGLLVDRRRQREAPEEPGVPPLLEQVVPLVLVVLLDLPLGRQGERLVLERDVDVLLLEA